MGLSLSRRLAAPAELSLSDRLNGNTDLLRTILDALDDAALVAVQAVDKQLHALVRGMLPVRVLLQGYIHMKCHSLDDDEEGYIAAQLDQPDGFKEKISGHLDLWPADATGRSVIDGLYTYRNDPVDPEQEGELIRGFQIRGSLKNGFMELSFRYTDTTDPGDDDGLGTVLEVSGLAGREVEAWSRGVYNRRLRLKGTFSVDWPSDEYRGGDATLVFTRLDASSFRERTEEWVSGRKVREFIREIRSSRLTHGMTQDVEFWWRKIAEARRLQESSHPSLLNREERSALPLFCTYD